MSEPTTSTKQTWWTPSAHKISSASLAGGFVAIVCYLLNVIWKIAVPPEVAAGVTGFLTQIISWALPDNYEADS